MVADREFIGKEWFSFLKENQINFTIRVKSNTLIKRSENDALPFSLISLFRSLKIGKRKFIKQCFWIAECSLYFFASRAPNGNLLIVASPNFSYNSLKIYKKRWEIEDLFACLKSRGFNLEATHLIDSKRLEKLLFVVTIAFCWSCLVGISKNEHKKIPIKIHKRKSISIFRYGYDVLRSALLRTVQNFRYFYRFLIPWNLRKNNGASYV